PRTMPLARPTRQIPDAAWTSGIRELTEPWKGALGCLGVAVFFAMTIGIISWQALETPSEEWVLRGRAGGLLWERRRGALLLRALPTGRAAASIAVVGVPAATEPPPPRDRCWHDGAQFCYAWEEEAELQLSLEPSPAPGTECYGVRWTPLRPDVALKDCFSMANVSWYGGASVHAQRWPLNGAESLSQPFVSGDLGKNPAGYGPVLDRYFLSSTGVTVTVAPDVPLVVSLESERHFCLETPAGRAAEPLRYLLCDPLTTLFPSRRAPIWHYHGAEGSAAKIKRGLRALAKRLKRHHLPEGVLALGERGTAVLAAAHDVPPQRRKRHEVAHTWDPAPLQLSITLSPYTSIASPIFLRSLRDGNATSPWLSLQPRTGSSGVPGLSFREGFPTRIGAVIHRGCNPEQEKRSFERGIWGEVSSGLPNPAGWVDEVEGASISLECEDPKRLRKPLRDRADSWGREGSVLPQTQVCACPPRSSHLPLFVQMRPLRSDWSHAGLKGLVPSVLHYSLLGYNFFIPDAVGGSLASDAPADPELYVRWLQIVTFLPVMAFSTPPWLCCDAWVLNLTRHCIQRHRDLVVPLLVKYSEEWLSLGHPVFRPVWWLSPTDPTAFTIEDEFLIGDEVLVAPITEKGQTWRDIYLPGAGHLWLDTHSARVFDGGTVLKNFSAGLAEVPVFVK
ncbi:SP15 protein, partial [Piaya cayana]|nr:SP15 protein [Piaya cayana]